MKGSKRRNGSRPHSPSISDSPESNRKKRGPSNERGEVIDGKGRHKKSKAAPDVVFLDVNGGDSATLFYPAFTTPNIGVGLEFASTTQAVAIGPKLPFCLPDLYIGYPPRSKEELSSCVEP